MNNDFEHLLSKHRVLNSFNISKRIRKSYISSLRKKLEKSGKSESEISEEINKKIILNTQKFIEENEIPGIKMNYNDNTGVYINEKTKNFILKTANDCVNKCKLGKLNKEQMIIFMQLFLHLAKITNEDVSKFKKRYGIENSDDSDYDDTDDEI